MCLSQSPMAEPDKKNEYIPDEWETVPCPVCNSCLHTPYERFGHRLQYTYVRCRDCANVYQSPRPKYDDRFLRAAYGNYYLFSGNHEYAETALTGFREEVAEIVTFDTARERLLDVGCAMGDFLFTAKDHYPIVCGTEISEAMASFTARKLGIRVLKVQFTSLDTAEMFSCIHMSHVIEHVPNPGDWLKHAKKILRPGGVLVLCVPNMFSFSRVAKLLLKRIGLRKGRWKNGNRTPDHLFEPTVRAMHYLLRHNGFQVLSIYSYSRSNMTARGPLAFLFQRVLKWGSNIRVFARPSVTSALRPAHIS
jgi:2-polyprenyl-3-methyl-5-hydroxy-6-metoxy-1,4-benzoquinol methylase